MLTATGALASLAAGEFSSVELLDAHIDQIDALNPSVNAVVAMDVDRAREEAAAADALRGSGAPLGPLAGLPMTVKDTYETAGLITTSGAPQLAGHVPDADADVVRALRAAGALVFGKTNTPLFAGDHQTYNDVYGLTRNPWDPERTAGGSSGGAAVAVACGFTTAEVGSDIGNSIRFPAHVNGVFGLKPTHGVVPLRGHIPGPPGSLGHPDLAVGGPLARSLDDLGLLLDAITSVGAFGGVPGAALPPSPGRPDVGSLRVAVWADDPVAPVAAACRDAAEGVARALEREGAVVDRALRPTLPSAQLHETYLRLLLPVIGADLPSAVWDGMVARAAAATAEDATPAVASARMMTASHRSWLHASEQRHRARAAWAALLDEVDAVVMPVAPTPAFPHTTELPYDQRTVIVDDEERPYTDLLFWAGLATMPGLPAVVLPTGAVDGLPVGVQIVGRRYGDLALLDVARTIAEVTGSTFVAPPLL